MIPGVPPRREFVAYGATDAPVDLMRDRYSSSVGKDWFLVLATGVGCGLVSAIGFAAGTRNGADFPMNGIPNPRGNTAEYLLDFWVW